MEHTPLRFDLFDITRIFLKWKKQIMGFAIIVGLLVAVYMLFLKNYYRGYAAFYPASSVISGRITLFRETQQDWIDFFGEENEVDRAYVISGSSKVVSFLIDSFKMAEKYDIEVINNKQGRQKVVKKFLKNYKVNRTGYNHIEVIFTNPDSELAAAIANVAMNKIEDELRELYVGVNKQLAMAIDIRKDSIDRELETMTDSLVNQRVKYGIYDIIAPSRKIMSMTAKGSGIMYAEGLEQIQNLEELKDKLATDKAKYVSLSNEFKTSFFKGFPMIHVVQWASPYGPKAGPYRIISVLSATLLALLFATLVACLVDIFENNKHRYAS